MGSAGREGSPVLLVSLSRAGLATLFRLQLQNGLGQTRGSLSPGPTALPFPSSEQVRRLRGACSLRRGPISWLASGRRLWATVRRRRRSPLWCPPRIRRLARGESVTPFIRMHRNAPHRRRSIDAPRLVDLAAVVPHELLPPDRTRRPTAGEHHRHALKRAGCDACFPQNSGALCLVQHIRT